MKRKISILFLCLWILFLFSGMAFKVSAKFFGWPDFNSYVINENRDHAEMPDLKKTPVKDWCSGIEAWYNDNFAWRSRIIQFYRYFHFVVIQSPVAREVPGIGDWVFRQGPSWPELDDYLGAYELTPDELKRWVVFFEGRVTWAEAHGSHYLQLLAPVKAQIHSEKMFPVVRNHRGQSVWIQTRDALKGSYAEDNVIFINDLLESEVRAGRAVFYEEDHHVNAYGCYLLYDSIIRRMKKWFPDLESFPFYNDPPDSVSEGREPGCYVVDRRLAVSYPGTVVHTNEPLLKLYSGKHRFPMISLSVDQPGTHRSIVIGHDSFMRFPLLSWSLKNVDTIRFPIGSGFDKITSYLFLRFSTGVLDAIVKDEIPDVIVEQFPEVRLTANCSGYDETMRRASCFGRGELVDSGYVGSCMALGVFENVTLTEGSEKIVAELKNSVGKVVASSKIESGVRRAVFFGTVKADGTGFHVSLSGGKCLSASCEIRKVSEKN